MDEKNVVETIHGKRHKYQVVKSPGGLFSSTQFNIYRDGSYYKGSYASLADAVARARKEG